MMAKKMPRDKMWNENLIKTTREKKNKVKRLPRRTRTRSRKKSRTRPFSKFSTTMLSSIASKRKFFRSLRRLQQLLQLFRVLSSPLTT